MTTTEERSRLLNEFLRKALQLVLYVCASNAEISPNSEQALITKRSSTIKDRYAEIRKWDVGARYGAAIRQYRKKESLPVMAMQEIPYILKSEHTSESKMLNVEENMARALTLKWSDYDTAKAVSY